MKRNKQERQVRFFSNDLRFSTIEAQIWKLNSKCFPSLKILVDPMISYVKILDKFQHKKKNNTKYERYHSQLSIILFSIGAISNFVPMLIWYCLFFIFASYHACCCLITVLRILPSTLMESCDNLELHLRFN